ncbi:MAG TPA: hypothetical protein PKI03_33640 [Pseudomonadota bacterium]|nr:hypothetical protein [Pseudomonadota bacterium]
MQSAGQEKGKLFLSKVGEYLVSLPFDLKILQEAVADPELPRDLRELAATVLINALSPQEGPSPERYLDDLIWLRLVLTQIAASHGAAESGFCARFEEVFRVLPSDLALFEQVLGRELWGWLHGKLATLNRIPLKGRRPAQYVDDESSWDSLYEDGLEFQTHYDVTEERVQNRLRNPKQIIEYLQRRFADDSKKRS